MKKSKKCKAEEKKIFYYTSEREDFRHIPGDVPVIDGEYEYIHRGFFAGIKYFVL